MARFLKNDQINAIINDLKSADEVPTDSESMKELFHKNGVNMRYLGELHTRLSAPPAS